MGTCSGRGGAGGGGAGGGAGGVFSAGKGAAASTDEIEKTARTFRSSDATEFMDSRNASFYSGEMLDVLTFDGIEFAPINYYTQGERIINEYQSRTPNSRGEYQTFRTVVTQHNYKKGKVYKWDRSTVTGTKFD